MSQSLQKQIPLTERGHRVFDMVRKFARGAQEIEISLISTTGEYLRFGNNELGQSQSTKNRTLSVRLSSGKKQARTTTGRLEESFIQKAVEKAVSQLKTSPEDPDYLPMLGQQSYQTVSRYHTRTVEESAETKAGYVGRAIELARDNKLLASGVLGTSVDEGLIINTSGLESHYRGTGGYFSLTMDADNGNQTGYALSTFADITELDARNVSETALERAKLNKAQTEVQPGKFDVVIDPHAWSEMLFFFIVSASAGYSPDFGTRQYKEGRSYLSGRIGEKIMGENVILEDDVYHPLQMGPPFDGEGYPKSKLTLVENGELRSLASSRISAHRYQDAKATGHELPLPNPLGETPTNLVIRGKGPTKTTEDLVGELDKGLLLTRLWYIREVEPRTKTLTGMTRDGTFLVENGEIKRPVKNLRFNQSLLELFNSIEKFTEPVRNTSFTGAAVLEPGVLARDFNFTSVSPF
ncbi:MAG TPA: TldD/PmbA family protein [Candidatus Limnocylindrales bacterium]|nr:TldD/PmbA family protein [Candidatus Limnocylindrales bacterium]